MENCKYFINARITSVVGYALFSFARLHKDFFMWFFFFERRSLLDLGLVHKFKSKQRREQKLQVFCVDSTKNNQNDENEEDALKNQLKELFLNEPT